MINKETAKVQYTTVADQSTWYAVDFEYFTTPATGLPQLKVLLGGQELTAGTDYVTGPQGIQLVVAPTAGVSLVIERDIPFTQEIDFQMGLIDPEKIERGLDESVMRDQELANGISDLDAKHDSLAEEVEEVRTVAEGAAADAASAVQTATDAASAAESASEKADEAKAAADNADSKAQNALDLANSYDTRITTAQDTADSAKTTADSAKTTADQALAGLDGKQDKGDYATKTELTQGLAGKADTSVTDALRNDVDGLDGQVSGIEEKIPADASSSNQLATKADLSNIDALPSQAGNEGKFLTTDGANASWAEIEQGGGLAAVVHDDTLEGDGTDGNPLKLSTATAAEITAAQSTADKADNAAEVAQQTANLAGQEAAQALSALAGKVNIAQGADNAGKVMTVGADGNLAPADAPAGGLPDQTGNAGKFLTTDGTNASWGKVQAEAITTDDTLAGAGTTASPLGVAQSVKDSIDGKVSKTGDTMTGVLNFNVPARAETIRFTPQSWLETTAVEQQIIWRFGQNDGWAIGYNRIRSEKDNFGVIGDSDYRLKNIYTYLLNNGADIAIPTTGGTLALTSDIPDTSNLATKAEVQQEIQDAIGTIETSLAEV